MKYALLQFFLLWSIVVSAQPTLTLDYYFQDGNLQEYNYYDIDTSILQLEGADVLWNFSNNQFRQFNNYSFAYQLDTTARSVGSYILPDLGTLSSIERPNYILAKTRAHGYENYEILVIDSAVHLIYLGLLDCDAIGGSYPNTLSPEKFFPTPLAFQEASIDTLQYLINGIEKDTIESTNSFIYSGYGSFIHPNGDTFCDVIQLKRSSPNHIGQLVETITWYSKEAGGPIAKGYKNVGVSQTSRVEIMKMDFANLSFTTKQLDTLKYFHTTRSCGYTLNFYPDNSCDGFSSEEIIHLDIYNDNSVDTFTSQKQLNFLEYQFPIGTHRIIFENPLSKEMIEQIVVIEDKNAPKIYVSCDGSGNYAIIPKDSSSILITPDDLFSRVSDNDCNRGQTFKFWLDTMEDIPNPDSLSIEEILSVLPDSYRINCFEEEYKGYQGWIYAFDLAGNWSRQSIYLGVISENCNYICPSSIVTKLSFQDIDGNPLDQIIAPAYGKEMDKQDNLYLYRICPTDSMSIRLDFKKISSVTENVSAFDLLLIQKHILGQQPFTTFRQYVAADANYSGEITAFDLLTIKRTILGLNNSFLGGQSWVFFEKKEGLLDQNPYIDVMPLHLLEEKRFELKDTTYHFLGIKLGDVNN